MNLWDDVLARRYPKPDGQPAAAVVAATAPPAGESEADIRKRAVAEKAENIRAIEAVCAWAGRPARAAGFVAQGKSLSAVVGILAGLDARAKRH